MVCRLGSIVAAGALAVSTANAAEIRIDRASFHSGLLIVSGALVPKAEAQSVTLNGRFTTSSDTNGRFTFRVQYLPFLCAAVVRMGDVERTRKVDNCIVDDTRVVPEPPLKPGR